MTRAQDDRPSLAFILSVYAVGVVLAYMLFKPIMIMVMVSILNSGASIGALEWLPDLIFAAVIATVGAALVFAYRRQTSRLAQMAAADS